MQCFSISMSEMELRICYLTNSQVMLMLLARDLTLRIMGTEEVSLMLAPEVLRLSLDSIITTFSILGK